MRGLVLTLMFVFFISFGLISYFGFGATDTYQPPEHVKIADSIQEVVGDRLEKRHALNTVAVSGALFDKINGLGFRFQVRGPKTKEELRALLIDCTEELVNEVNGREGIVEHLGSPPFTYNEVDIAIFNHDKKNHEIFYPQYCTASISGGRFRYCTMDEDGMGYKTIESESYEEALKALGREVPLNF